MKNLIKKISITMAMILILNIILPINTLASNIIRIENDDGSFNWIEQRFEDLIVITYLYDSVGNIIDKLEYDKQTGILTNTIMNKSIKVNDGIKNQPCEINNEYEVCSLGDIYYSNHSITVGQITSMISVRVSIASILLIICGISGVAAFTACGVEQSECTGGVSI